MNDFDPIVLMTVLVIFLMGSLFGGIMGAASGRDEVANYVCVQQGYVSGSWDDDNGRILCDVETTQEIIEIGR